MDGDSNDKQITGKTKRVRKTRKQDDALSNDSNVPQPPGVRCAFCYDSICNWLLLDYGYYFIWPVSIFLWIIFLFKTLIQ